MNLRTVIKLALIVSLPTAAGARIGETLPQLAKRYGPPTWVGTNQTTLAVFARYRHNGFELLVHVSGGKCVTENVSQADGMFPVELRLPMARSISGCPHLVEDVVGNHPAWSCPRGCRVGAVLTIINGRATLGVTDDAWLAAEQRKRTRGF